MTKERKIEQLQGYINDICKSLNVSPCGLEFHRKKSGRIYTPISLTLPVVMLVAEYEALRGVVALSLLEVLKMRASSHE